MEGGGEKKEGEMERVGEEEGGERGWRDGMETEWGGSE